MERLPDELLLQIFEELPGHELHFDVGRVCRRWAALVARRVLLVRRDADTCAAAGAGPPATRVLLQFGGVLPALHLAGALLAELTLHAGAPLGRRDVGALQRLPRLRHLDVFLRAPALDGAALPALRRVRSLVVNEVVAPGVLRALASRSRLEELHMFGRALYYPRRELGALLVARRDRLRELTLRCPELHDAEYAAIGSCPNLTSLQLYSCWMLTGDGALELTRATRLRRLHVSGARMLRPRALAEFVRRAPAGVEQLALGAGWLADEHAGALAARLPRLRALELWRCRVTPRGALRLAARLRALRDLDLDLPLTAADVCALASHPTLERLRCLRAPPADLPASPDPESEPEPEPAGRPRAVSLVAAPASCPRSLRRGDGEGFAADVFYYWAQRRRLAPLPLAAHPALLLYEFGDYASEFDSRFDDR